MIRPYIVYLVFVLSFASNCEQPTNEKVASSLENEKIEKEAILETIENETKAAFARDYKAWKNNWIQHPNISKTYINFADSSFSEMIGWKEIDDFVRTYIENHPEPVPSPAPPTNIDVRLYGNGAWVSYEIMDEVFGLKRETRLMEKEESKWKIAGLHTTIYGFIEQE